MAAIAHNAKQKSPEQVGREIPGLVAEYLLASKSFKKSLANTLRNIVQAQVMQTQRSAGGTNGSGVNQIKIKRTGSIITETPWYTVWGTMYVPIAGDQIMCLLDGATVYILASQHGGRPNEHTIMYPGSSIRRYDSSRLLFHKHGDDHHSRHYGTDGSTVVHHHHAQGHHKHLGDHYANVHSIADDGTPAGPYHRSTMSGAVHTKYVHDGASEKPAWQHDGTTYVAYAATKQAIRHDGSQHSVYHQSNSATPMVAHATSNPGGDVGGQTLHKRATTATFHAVGDGGLGNGTTIADYSLVARSQSSSHQIAVSRASSFDSSHVHDADGHHHPSSAQVNAPHGDSSVINVYSSSSSGAVKRASHAVVVGGTVNGGSAATIADPGPTNIFNYTPGGGASSDPHFKLVMASVYWNSVSNPAVYSDARSSPGVNAGNGIPVGQGGGSPDANHQWNINTHAPDGSIGVFGYTTGGAGSKAVQIAVWTHIVD